MPLDVVLLVLRIAISLSLYLFVGGLFYVIWRDMQRAAQRGPSAAALARLVVVESDDELPFDIGREYSLQSLATLGRSPTSTIVLPDTFASTEHARIVRRRGQWWLEDLNSRNGTLLNGTPISGSVVLSSGDMIGIGRVKFRFETR